MLGGQKIVNGRGRCSSNISAQDSADNWYAVTAGHCFATNDAVAHGNSDSLNTNTYSSAKGIGRAQPGQVSKDSLTTCDCRVVGPIAAGRRAARTLVDNNEQFGFNFVAGTLKRYTGRPIACENGVSSYREYGGISCGPVDFPDEDVKICFPDSYCYYLLEGFKVSYPSGRKPIPGDSGTSVGSGDTLLGVLATSTGFASETYNLTDVYRLATWVVPAH